MKKVLCLLMATFISAAAFAQEEPKEPTPEETAAKEAERLEKLLNLDPAQSFYVDSILQHNLTAMIDEIKGFQKARVGNADIYIACQDKWMERTDRAYEKIFDEKQWAAYLKSGAAKAQKARDKRKARNAAILDNEKEK